jgi:hypothetical protein
MKTPAPTPILDISTKRAPASKVRIDGKLYALRTRDEVGMLPNAPQHGEGLIRLGVLIKKRGLTPAEARERGRLLRALTSVIVIAPRAVLAKLQDTHRTGILAVFVKGA